MVLKQLTAAVMVLGFGVVLGSCSPVAGFVADHWPHWAGGMPDDVPPRPGTPGYADFIAHKQADTDAAKSAGTGEKTNAQAAPAGNPAPNDPAAVQGGLY